MHFAEPTNNLCLAHCRWQGRARSLGGEQFYQFAEAELLRTCDGLLASEYIFVADWPNWEMHPDCDEFIYLLSGDTQLDIEHLNGIGLVVLDVCRAVIVPRGV